MCKLLSGSSTSCTKDTVLYLGVGGLYEQQRQMTLRGCGRYELYIMNFH